MAKLQLGIQIEKPFVNLIDRHWLRRAVECTLAHCRVASRIELSLLIAGDETVHKLNKTYRGVDRTTDVIAFALSEAASREDDGFITAPDRCIHLGEVIISYPQAKRQAREHRHSIKQELALLVTHGVLHLLGYDHELPEEERRMRGLEAEVLEEIEARK